MVRNYKRKTDGPSISAETLAEAICRVQIDKESVVQVCRDLGINKRTFYRNSKKLKDLGVEAGADNAVQKINETKMAAVKLVLLSNYSNLCVSMNWSHCSHLFLQVFSPVQEKDLVEYLLKCSDIYFGLTPKDIRLLAYQFAKKLNVKYPETWNENEMAGEEWLTSFLKRNSIFSLQKPQATSIAHAPAFNRTTVASTTCSIKVNSRADCVKRAIMQTETTSF